MKERSRFMVVAAACLIVMCVAAGPLLFDADAAHHEEAKEKEIGFIHMVFFWINEDASGADVKQLMDDCKNLLGEIKTVKKVEVGKPAGTERDVVDNSYGVSLIVYFKDSAGHDHYQTAQKHLDFIERNKETWSKVQVYDMVPE